MDDNTLDPNTQNQSNPITPEPEQVPTMNLETGEISNTQEPTIQMAEETPAQTPAQDPTPTITYIPETQPLETEPTIETTPVTEDITMAEQTPVTEEMLMAEQTPVAEEMPMAEQTPVAEEVSTTEEPSVTEETPMTETLPQTAETTNQFQPQEDKTEKVTKILKTVVPIIVGLVVIAGGYFVYANFIKSPENPSIDQSQDIPNFLNTYTEESEEIPSEYEDALEELIEETQSATEENSTTQEDSTAQEESTTDDTQSTEDEITNDEFTEETSSEEPAQEETPKVKVPRS